MAVPRTLTEAQNSQAGLIIMETVEVTTSNAREIPYSELYRGSTGVMETPAERLQRVAQQDAGIDVDEPA